MADYLKTTDDNFIDGEVEKSFLSGVLFSPQEMPKYIQINPNIFGFGSHRIIRGCVIQSWKDVGSVDHVLIRSAIKKIDESIDSYYREICTSDFGMRSVEYYLENILEMRKRREIMAILHKTSYLLKESSELAISNINEKIREIGINEKTAFDFMDLVVDVMDSKNVKDNIVCKTGFNRLDEKIQGFREGQLVIVSGRPGMGKTLFATNLLFRNIVDGHKAVFFSLEMTPTQITQRLLSKGSKIPLTKIMTKSYSQQEEETIGKAFQKFLELEANVKIETKTFNINEIVLKIRTYNFLDGIKIFYIDQLQRISAKGDGRVFEIENITNQLKNLATDLGIVIILMCQLNRDVGQRDPQLHNLKNSGSIEQDADIVLFPHRDNYGDHGDKTDTIRVIVAKNRNGDSCECVLGLNQDCMHIYDIK